MVVTKSDHRRYREKGLGTLLLICALYWANPLFLPSCEASPTYANVTRLFEDLLGAQSGYNHAVRPTLNQSEAILVNVTFDIIAIVEVDAIGQKYIVNGFLGLHWNDELLVWNFQEYGYTFLIHPYPHQIWRPRLILANTLENRDLFEDDYSPVILLYNGSVSWFPGSLFPTSCKLDLYRYPFDLQTCSIDMFSMGLSSTQIQFTPATGVVSTTFYVESGEWKIEGTKIESSTVPDSLAYFRIHFTLRRLPGFFIVNIVAPIVLMSFLNILVFIIPVESGEKISYGITVLLALTVFMSIVSSQLPRSSDTLPLVTIYLLVLTVISVLTVMVSVIIVYFHHREEKETKRQKATSNFKGIFNKIRLMNRTASNFTQVQPHTDSTTQATHDTSIRTSLTVPDKSNSDKTETVLSMMSNLKNRVGDGSGNNVNNKSRPTSGFSRAGAGNSNGGGGGGGGGGGSHIGSGVNRWRQIGKHLDFVSFVVFTCIWVSVTIGFLVEIAS